MTLNKWVACGAGQGLRRAAAAGAVVEFRAHILGKRRESDIGCACRRLLSDG
jgi:hypothetical protein